MRRILIQQIAKRREVPGAKRQRRGGCIFQMALTNQSPPMIRAVLPRPPLSGALILGNAATLELNCDCWAKAETYSQAQADAAFAPISTQTTANNNFAAIQAIDTRVTALEGSGGVPADISCNSLTASSFVNTLSFTATLLARTPSSLQTSRHLYCAQLVAAVI